MIKEREKEARKGRGGSKSERSKKERRGRGA
jgi:hypothetical protein